MTLPAGHLRVRVSRALKTRTARASSWALLGQFAGIAASLANFLLLARLIGPAEYGLVAGAWALVLALGPLLTFGSERLLIRDVSGSGLPPAQALTGGIVTVLAGSAVAAVLIAVLHPVLLPQVPFVLLAALGVADIAAMGVYGCLLSTCLATDRARAGGVLATSVGVAKIGAVLTFSVVGGREAEQWALLYAGFAVGTVLMQVLWAYWRFGRPRLVGYRLGMRLREGTPYSLNQAAAVVLNDSDKILLVRSGYAVEAGLYSVASRLATTAYMPILAVLTATQPRFFALGSGGQVGGAVAFARRLVVPLTAYGIVVGLALVAFAPLIPVLVGDQYSGSVTLLMVLAVLPLFRVLSSVPGDVLTGSGRQTWRTGCTTVAAVLNVGLNVTFVPEHGLLAAVPAALASQLTLIVLVNAAVQLHRRRERASSAAADALAPASRDA